MKQKKSETNFHVAEKSNKIFNISNFRVGPGHPVFVIAEIGINHEGDSSLCAEMIKAAAASGANAVKLQTIDPVKSYVAGTDSYKEFKGKELSDRAMTEMLELAQDLDLLLFSTPGDFHSLARICKLGLEAIKISSGLLTNFPLIAAAARTGLPLIISTGMAYENEIAEAIQTAKIHGANDIAILKCTSLYPAPDETINFSAIPTFKSKFCIPVGYSDHTLDNLACLAAVVSGADIIEKHFTLDKLRFGADHRISSEPSEFAAMVVAIRRLENMRGNSYIKPVEAEIVMRTQRHRCLVASTSIKTGEIFSTENVALKRPLPGLVGLEPRYFDLVIGQIATRSLQLDEPIKDEHILGFKLV